MNRLRENKAGSQTQTEENTLSIKGKQQNNRNTELLQEQMPTFVETDYVITTAVYKLYTEHFKEKNSGWTLFGD